MPLHSSYKCSSPSDSQMNVTFQRNLPGDAGAQDAPSLNPDATLPPTPTPQPRSHFLSDCQSPLVGLLEFSSLAIEC